MDIRLIYLPSGGLAETHGNVVAVGRKLIAGQWWLTTAGAKTTAMPAEISTLADTPAY